MIMCVLLCYPVSIRIYYQQGVIFLVLLPYCQIPKILSIYFFLTFLGGFLLGLSSEVLLILLLRQYLFG